ncbi:MAG: AGE family epimerase/isomerase [Candidatus Latescibacterota bacterium]
MRGLLHLLLWGIVLSAAPAAARPNAEEVERVRLGLERMLRENIIPFWYPQSVDLTSGGYRLNHDANGTWLGAADKGLIDQARTLWFYARLYNSGYGTDAHLRAARHGYVFLQQTLRDEVFGGYFWAVNSDGTVATRPHKHLYAQSFALYALSEYVRASGEGEAIGLAEELFYLLEEKAHDATYGGYVEWFRRDWEQGPETGHYMGTEPDGKLMNTHLHLLEALTTFWEVTGDELARERLLELMFIQSSAVVRKDVGACTDRYARDWTPFLDAPHDRVSYGHDVENAWLLAAASRAVGVPNGPLVDLYKQLVDNALLYGFDRGKGGFYESGPLGQPADDLDKIWWVQAEGLVALLSLYQMTGNEAYWSAFIETYEWVEGHQVDWDNGDWHAQITPDGTSSGAKAGRWKTPYHSGRAVLECLRMLESIDPSSDQF